MAVKQPTNPNPALMESLLAQARNKNLASLNEVNQAKIGARKMNQVELDKVNQTKARNQNELNLINLNRQNKPNKQQQTDPELIERILNQKQGFDKENANQDQEGANNPDQVNGNNAEDPVMADRQAGERSRGERMNQLGRKNKGDTAIPEISEVNETPQAQENSLAEKKQSQATPNIPNIPGIGSLTGGINPNDSPEEIAKKGIKMAAKKVIISVLLWASPFIIGGLAIALLLAFILIPTVMVYNCYQQMGYLEKGSFLWSAFWGDFGGTLKKAMSSDCFAEDNPNPETTKKEAPPTQTDPPPPEEGTP
jgi:hypothetical protein